jgi:hypothetical protein
MKRFLMASLTFLVAALPFSASAQVKEGEKLMSLGNNNSLSIELPKIKADFAEKIWKNYVKPYKGKYARDKKDKNEYFLDNALIAGLGAGNTVDVHANFQQMGENTLFTAWFNLGGAFVSSAQFKEQYTEAEKIVLKYAIETAAADTKIQLEDQQKELQKQEKQLKKLEDKNADYKKDIENWKAKIKQAEADIESNLKSQGDQKTKIGDQRKLVTDIQAKLDSLK